MTIKFDDIFLSERGAKRSLLPGVEIFCTITAGHAPSSLSAPHRQEVRHPHSCRYDLSRRVFSTVLWQRKRKTPLQRVTASFQDCSSHYCGDHPISVGHRVLQRPEEQRHT
ncbi:hypothetical protein MATL_G00239160 [Megalops atlanticus]|uniref:Uncharacterized protein n=1 Tax=Megalops atlanticus TaxID=7932 RepID=A0A9D3PDJ7_MEGAT|nr:hypothetical protein MATL_G00239160 [Megalops atlanticus]